MKLLLIFLMSISYNIYAQKKIKNQTITFKNIRLIPEKQGGDIYILKESNNLAILKFNHDKYGINSKTFDLLCLNKKSYKLWKLISYEEMVRDFIDYTEITIQSDTVHITGTHFIKGDLMRTAFKSSYLKGKKISSDSIPFKFPMMSEKPYKFFEDFKCIGTLGDSTYAFTDTRIYSEISPWTQMNFFNQRKVYIYHYKTQVLETFEFPKLLPANLKKVHEEVAFENDSFVVRGFYTDTLNTTSKYCGIYQSNLYNQTYTKAPITFESNNSQSLNSYFAWNSYNFQIDSGCIHLQELSDQNIILSGFINNQASWSKIITNHSTRGPYPKYIKVGNQVIVLKFDHHQGFLKLQKNYEMSHVNCQFYRLDILGNLDQLILTKPIKTIDTEVYLESLFTYDNNSFGMFSYNQKKHRLELNIFSL